jgi:replicative DNA helicase
VTASPLLYDLEAESCVLGACLLSAAAVEVAVDALVPGDFGAPSNGAIFEAIAALYREGSPTDWKTTGDQLRAMGAEIPPGRLTEQIANVPATSPAAVARYAKTVWEFALRRRLTAEGAELMTAACNLTRDPAVELDRHKACLAAIDSPALAGDPDDLEIGEFLAQPISERAPWVIPGLLRTGHRAVVTAPEGVGKSTLLRQLAVLTAFGLHPFTFAAIEPMPTLIVDLENPRDVVHAAVRRLVDQAERQSLNRSPASVWLQPGGINLRIRRDRVAFENVLRRRRPRLVVLGPVYKSYTRRANESDEQVASEVQAVLDDLRVRFNDFALLLEHHSAKGTGGWRDLQPFGSSLWLRWPDAGIKAQPVPDKPGVLKLGRWRGDRAEVRWPDELHRDSVWPFVGKYSGGVNDAPDVDDERNAQEPAF